RFGDSKQSGELWKLGGESPTGGIYKLLELKEISVATSGNYRNFFRAGGKRDSHILDPDTGRPVENPPASATVRHESCMMADAWATSMIVLGPERGMQIAQTHQLDVMILMVDENQVIQELSTDYFRSVLRHEPPVQSRPSP
ncbi:MAG: FAD:protein FMN transferase, partial [Planctomyces sp.]